MPNTELISEMKILMSGVFSFYLKAHRYHWNVTGLLFYQFHAFFSDIYTNVHASIDDYAEHIRQLGDFPPGTLVDLEKNTFLSSQDALISDALEMMDDLSSSNELIIAMLKKTRETADQANEYGLVSFLESRLEYHEKLKWQLVSTTE